MLRPKSPASKRRMMSFMFLRHMSMAMTVYSATVCGV